MCVCVCVCVCGGGGGGGSTTTPERPYGKRLRNHTYIHIHALFRHGKIFSVYIV